MAVTIWSPLPLGAADRVRVGEAQLELTESVWKVRHLVFFPFPGPVF
jgi:hypothetical protein